MDDGLGGDIPLLVGSLTNEWQYFSDKMRKKGGADYSASSTISRFLAFYLGEKYFLASDAKRACARSALLSLYPAASHTNDCEGCDELEDPREIALAGDMQVTIGAQLVGYAKGSIFRFVLDLNGTHADDVGYVFSAAKAKTKASRRLGAMIRSYWISFAKTGVPRANDLPVWEPMASAVRGELLGRPFLAMELHGDTTMSGSGGKSDLGSSQEAAAVLAVIVCGPNVRDFRTTKLAAATLEAFGRCGVRELM